MAASFPTTAPSPARPPALWRREDGKLVLALHQGQTDVWKSLKRFILMLAGSQSGKTSFGSWWLRREIETCGTGDYLVATASFDLLKLRLLPSLEETFTHVLGIGRYWAGDRIIEISDPKTGQFMADRATDPMYARIILRSAAAEGGLESATAKAAWFDEAGQESVGLESWEAILRRLALAQGRVLLTTTPYNLGWLKTQVYDRWAAGDPDYDVIQFASTLNPVFPQAEFERAKSTMPDWRFRMFYLGEFSRPAGMIYPDFDTALMVIDPIHIPASWPIYCGVDFGGVNCAFVWVAEDPATSRYYLFRESLTGGMASGEHAAAAKRQVAGRNFIAAWGGAGNEEQWRRDFSRCGFPVRQPPIKDVEGGIDRVTELFRTKRWFVFNTCRGWLDEVGSYRRKLDALGQPTEDIADKRAFHRLDATRYLATGLVRSGGRWGPYSVSAEREVAGPFGTSDRWSNDIRW